MLSSAIAVALVEAAAAPLATSSFSHRWSDARVSAIVRICLVDALVNGPLVADVIGVLAANSAVVLELPADANGQNDDVNGLMGEVVCGGRGEERSRSSRCDMGGLPVPRGPKMLCNFKS